ARILLGPAHALLHANGMPGPAADARHRLGPFCAGSWRLRSFLRVRQSPRPWGRLPPRTDRSSVVLPALGDPAPDLVALVDGELGFFVRHLIAARSADALL